MRDDIDLKYFKKHLEERLAAINKEQERQKEDAAPVELDQARVGRLSRMDAMQQQAMSQAVARLTFFGSIKGLKQIFYLLRITPLPIVFY